MVRSAGLLLLLLPALSSQTPIYDTLIRDVRILDGAGNPWFTGDVAIRGGEIAAVGRAGDARARETVEGAGLALAPGFIDIHSHGRRGIEESPSAENYIRQGVTTMLEGQDGSSPVPLRPYLEKLGSRPLGVNVGLTAGHGSIRTEVMGTANRPATSEELERMKRLMRQAMIDGAFGLSTGLFYVPGNYASTEEVIEIAKVAGGLGGFHISHMRDEAALVLESVRETIRIGEEGGLPTQITHHKIIGKPNWGKTAETLKLVEDARARGVDVTIDQYPYTASSTGLAALFPQWALAGGREALAERLAAGETRAKIKAEIVRRILEDRGAGDPSNIVMASCAFDSSLNGKSLAEITRARGRKPAPEEAAETAIDLQTRGSCSCVFHAIGEEDVRRVLASPWTMVASDGEIPAFGRAHPHPRSYGTFARVLGRYVREQRAVALEEAVRKMTSLPAARMGLRDRGLLREGMKADLVLFDPAAIGDRATFENPHQYAVGVHSVWVNGIRALADGKMTGQLGGRVLLGPATEDRK
jgi:dihydroorotase/N-acyl-D-amino-acid deacylase